MQENQIGLASFGGDVDAILPDGWEEGKDLFADSTPSGEDILAGTQEPDLGALLENELGTDASQAPTTGDSGDDRMPAEESASESAEAEKTSEQASAEEPAPRILKLKVNHEEREVDVNSMSDDELRALLQKGHAFDDLRDRENKKIFRSVYQEQIDAGMTEAAAKLIAREAAGKVYALTDEEEAQQASVPAVDSSKPQIPAAARDFRGEVEQLKAIYPEFREVPDEVAHAVAKGAPLLTAYVAYRDKQNAKAAEALKKENDILKRNAAAASRAPVRGVTGGGDTAAPRKDIFESGFDAGLSWR